jgi:hypothetical protein
MEQLDKSLKKRVNISITEQTHKLLKDYADSKNTTVSQAISDWIWKEKNLSMSGIANRDWFEKLDGESLQRILAFCDEHRTTPPQAIKD